MIRLKKSPMAETAYAITASWRSNVRYGENNPYRSLKLYGQENKDEFYRTVPTSAAAQKLACAA